MGDDLRDALLAAGRDLACSPALERLAWHCHWLLYGDAGERSNQEWPELPEKLFHALVLLSGLPGLLARNSERGIADAITLEALSELELWIRHYRKVHGLWGLMAQRWMLVIFRGRAFKIGRLQFMFDRFEHPFRLFRHVSGKRVLMLADDGCRFRSDGRFASADGTSLADDGWSARLKITADLIRGRPVDPCGHLLDREVELPATQWRQVLQEGDDVLSVHIPATGAPLESAACAAAFRQALSFFSEHFPDVRSRAGGERRGWKRGKAPHAIRQVRPPASADRQLQMQPHAFPRRGFRSVLWSPRVYSHGSVQRRRPVILLASPDSHPSWRSAQPTRRSNPDPG